LYVSIADAPLDLERKYQLATKSYLAQGKDGYDVLAQGKVILDEENARLLPAIVRNSNDQSKINRRTKVRSYLAKLNVLSGFRRVRVNEIVRNAFKPVRFRRAGSEPNPLT